MERWLWARDLLEPLVRVPRVLLVDRSVPAVVVEDLGPVDLLERSRLDPKRAEPLFRKAAESVAALRRIPPAVLGDVNSPLDASHVRRELDLARTEFFGGLLGQKWDSRRRSAWDEWAFRLGERLDSLPRIACHRDYRAENLIPTEGGEVGIVDFQDLRAGPLGLDIATLLFQREALDVVRCDMVDDILRDYARWLGLGVSDLTRAVALCRLERGWRAVGSLARDVRRGRSQLRTLMEIELEGIASLAEGTRRGIVEMPDFVASALSDVPRRECRATKTKPPRPSATRARRRRPAGAARGPR